MLRTRILTHILFILCLAIPSAWAQKLLLAPDDFARINQQAQQADWAAQVRTGIMSAAENWATNYQTKFGLSAPDIPSESGQWSLWYVCPTHGVSLRFTAPNRHVCPVDNNNFSGWPYDQVILARRHEDLAQAALDNGLAYQLTKNEAFAQATARILLGYADRYSSYAIHDINNRNTRSGARVLAQTLDESIWLINVAWAYDLIANSTALNQSQKDHIVTNLLKAAAQIIERNDTKENNWQSWHNAAMGAVGFATNDQTWITKAIDGPSGFRFQMNTSITGEGEWYEGAWGYHFYALDALTKLAEMATRNGINLYAEPNLRRMFEMPLKFSFSDLTLPAFNDSTYFSLAAQHPLYELGFARYGDPLLAAPLGIRARTRNALLWGVQSLPASKPPVLPSEVFPKSGYASLRAANSDHALILKFGPHGGWHGHPDKLNFISFARGGIQAVDPGTQSYAAPTHTTWDKTTVSHNTMVVDEKTQSEATGNLLWSWLDGPMTAVRADAGQAYANTKLERTMFLTAEYAVDVFEARATDGAEHRFDWVYHNYGQAATGLPLSEYAALPKTAGYQHLTNNRAAVTGNDWQLDFDGVSRLLTNYGSVFASTTGVKGTFTITREQAATGKFAAAVNYDLSNSGYLLYTTPTLTNQPKQKPRGLRFMIYGDGSGNRLTLRLNDATDERFSTTVGPINWTGWRAVEVLDPERWGHFLGNNDGVVDAPIRNLSLQLDPVANATKVGKLFVDDLTVLYPDNGDVVASDFEQTLRNLRVWMLGAPQTTVVTGNGLGPDLLTPVPYVMARRQGKEARFVTLLEPYGESSRIAYFRELGQNSWQVVGTDFSDTFTITNEGKLEYQRRTRSRRNEIRR